MKNNNMWVSVTIVSVLLVLTGYYFAVENFIKTSTDRGLFGDTFGGVTALFSGLAFAGMIFAIILQSRELKLQRVELKLTREEYEASRKVQEITANAQKELVDKQLLTARIQGMSAIVQGAYLVASSHGVNVNSHLEPAIKAKELLKNLLRDAGMDENDIDAIR
jgi:hypothetical protein